MNLSLDTTTTEQRIADLRAILSLPSDQIRKAKGSALGPWQNVLASLLGDPSAAVEQEFEDSRGRLPARVVAPAAVKAWDAMPLSRRQNYLQWIDGLESERAAAHRITLAAGLLRNDAETSQAQILAVSLNSKENVTRLAEELLNRHSEELSGLFPGDAPLYKVLKVAQCLVQIAGHERSEPQARYHTLRTVLAALGTRLPEGKAMFTTVFDTAGKILDGFPANLHRQLAQHLESAPELHARFFPNPHQTLSTSPSPQPTVSDAAQAANGPDPVKTVNTPSASTGPESYQTAPGVRGPEQRELEETSRAAYNPALKLFNLFEEASQYIRGVEEEKVRLSSDVSSRVRQIDALEGTLATVREERDAALKRQAAADSANEGLTSRITTLTTELQTIHERSNKDVGIFRETESRLAILNTRVAELTEEKQQLIGAAAKEKENLLRQVQGTAETRLDEIKNDIGFAVRRVVRDVPDKSTKVNPDSAQRMLIRLHEVLSELERRGIRVKGD